MMTQNELYKFDNRAKNRKEIKCSHQTKEGVLTLERITSGNDVKCKLCNTEFNINPVQMTELEKAIKIIRDSIAQTRCKLDNNVHSEMNEFLGVLHYNAGELETIYERILTVFEKK